MNQALNSTVSSRRIKKGRKGAKKVWKSPLGKIALLGAAYFGLKCVCKLWGGARGFGWKTGLGKCYVIEQSEDRWKRSRALYHGDYQVALDKRFIYSQGGIKGYSENLDMAKQHCLGGGAAR